MLRKAITLAILGILLLSTAIYASFEWQFPITVTDTSNTAHTYYPIDLGFGTDALVTAGKLDADGLDSNLQEGATSLAFMNATSRVMGVLPSLPALEGRTVDYYTGYAPAQTSTEIVVGQDGYVTTLDNADLEPSDSFELTISSYFLGSGAADIFKKLNALRLSYNGTAVTLKAGDNAAPDITLTATVPAGEHVIKVDTSYIAPIGGGETHIANAVQLQNMNLDLTADYILDNDIDLVGVGWTTIGNSVTPFTGTFNGDGHTLSNLTINTASDYQGLFGYINGGKVTNVILENFHITGRDYVGALCGYLNGSALNESSYVTVTNCAISARSIAGGMCGVAVRIIKSSVQSGTVSTSGSPTGKDYVGGFTGGLFGYVTDCYSLINVSGSSGQYGGGFAAYGSASGYAYRCYSTGSVSLVSTSIGGFIGDGIPSPPNFYAYSYWDTQTSGLATSDGGTGKTTAQMQTQATFETYNFTDIWAIVPANYPTIIPLAGAGMDGTLLNLYVDDMGTPVDSEEMTTPIPDNANDWIWYPNPYFNYVILETSN